MSMNAGRMVWHRTRLNPSKWSADSHLDDHAWYTCEKQDYGGWLAQFVRRRDDVSTDQPGFVVYTPPMRYLTERIDIGWRPKLADAKQLCDKHHHAAILASDNDSLKGYIKRWPL